MAKKPKRVIVGYKTVRQPGRVVNEGGPAQTEMTAKAGTTKRTYTPSDVNTTHEAYQPGSGQSEKRRIMDAALAKARREKKDVTDFVPAGKGGREVTFGAGKTTEVTTPAQFKTTHKVNPRLTLPGKPTVEPIYKTVAPPGSSKKRRLPHVKYLEVLKRNKRTEAGYGR